MNLKKEGVNLILNSMTEQKLTPEYIASISATLTEVELADLIRDYANEIADDASYWATKNSY